MGSNSTPNMGREDVTPARAEFLLKRNVRNRKVSTELVLKYALDMVEGRWIPTGDPIQFDNEGNLIDGQHRLEAIKLAGVTIPLVTARGMSKDAQMVIDTGRPRRVYDNLQMLGHTESMYLTSVINEVYRWEHGFFEAKQGSKYTPTTLQTLDLMDRHPGAVEWMRLARTGYSTFRGVPVSIGGSLGYLFDNINSDEAHWFWEHFWQGTNLTEGDPVLTLRNTTGNWLSGHGRPLGVIYRATVIKAWNGHLEGKSMRHLAWRQKQGEPFPLPLGVENVPWVKLTMDEGEIEGHPEMKAKPPKAFKARTKASKSKAAQARAKARTKSKEVELPLEQPVS